MSYEDEVYESNRCESVFTYSCDRGYYTRADRSRFQSDFDAGRVQGLEQGHSMHSLLTTALPIAGIGMGLIGVISALIKQEIAPLNFSAVCGGASIGAAVAYHFADLATHSLLRSRDT